MSGAFLSLNGKRVVAGRVTIPFFGTWAADIELADAETVKGAVTLTLGDLELKGYGRSSRAAAFGGKGSVRIVGGAGGWNKIIKPKGYSHAAGVKLSAVLQDAANAAGESIVVTGDKTIGKVWARKQGRASRVLRLLLDGQWWVDADGRTYTKARSTTSIATPFQIISYKPHLGLFEIATENFKDWMPGRRFNSATLATAQTISSVTFTIADGKIRLQVTNAETTEERLLQEIRAIIRDEISRLEYGSIVEYVITDAKEMEIACKPSAGKDSPWPELAGVKLTPGLFGEVVTPTVGKKCLIIFMDNDPALYRCLGVEGPTEKTTWEASGNIEATAGGVFKVNGGSNFVALANLVNDNFTTLVTKFNSHVHGTGVGPSTPPTVPLVGASDFPSVACAKLKTA